MAQKFTTFSPLSGGYSRVFIIEGRARGDHKPDYQQSMAAGAPSWSFGDVTSIEVPSPDAYGDFLEIGSIRGTRERVTIPLTGRYAADLKSTLLRLARQGCAIDVQINMGSCDDPTNYNLFTKKLILEDALFTSYDADDLGALSSDDQNPVNETVELSAREMYEVVQISWAERAKTIITNEIVDVAMCGKGACDECDESAEPCQEIYAVTLQAGGSATTPADIVFSPDGGTTFYARDIDTLGVAEDPTGVECFGDYVVVISNDSNSLHYAQRSDFDGTSAVSWTEITTGFQVGGEPNAIWNTGRRLIIVGDGGYIYESGDPTDGVTVLDAGVATANNYNSVHSFGDDTIILGAASDTVVYTNNGTVFDTVTTAPGSGGGISTVWAQSKSIFFAGSDNGSLYFTVNTGGNWSTSSFHSSGTGVVRDIYFATDAVGYLSHDTTAPLGRVLRTTNGGYDWVVMPEGSGTLPANDRINAIAACDFDPDIVIAGGLADNATDGFLLLGTA